MQENPTRQMRQEEKALISPPKATKAPTISRLALSNWRKGYSSDLDDARTPQDGLRASNNVLLDQDGVIRPWMSLVEFGPQPEGTILGSIGEFKEVDGADITIWMITVQNVAGTAKVYIRKDDDAWIVCNGKTYDTSAECYFTQVDDKVLVTNGVDNLSYLDIPTKDVIPFTSLTTPANLAGTVGAGLTGTTYSISVQVTASNNGETAGSTKVTKTVSKIREVWSAADENISWTWDRVTGADRYHVYLADTAGGTPEYLTTITDPGSGTTVTFLDNGSLPTDLTRTVPAGDTTAGPKFKRTSIINGQVFGWGDPDDIRTIRFGGTGEDVLDFSPYDGGGSTKIGNGGKEVPVQVKGFRRGSGDPAITVLCQSTGGKGRRYILTPDTITAGETIISYFKVEEDSGEDGTDAPDSVIVYKDGLWYFSLDGVKTTYTKAQVQSILSTDNASNLIQPDIANINLNQIDKCVGVAFEDRLYWALPVGSESNNQIWTLDLKTGRGWMLPRTCNADWIGTYQDNSGSTRFIALVDNTIYEFSYSQLTTDGDEAFGTYARSGIIKFSEDGMEWAKVIDVTFVLLRPQGNIQLTISGLTEDNEQAQSIGSNSYTSTTSISGWGQGGWADQTWGETVAIPATSGITRKTTTIEIDEELNWLQWELQTTESGCDYALSDVIIRYVNIGTKDLTE